MKRHPRDRRCTYLVTLEQHVPAPDELQELAEYLSFLSVCDLDVVVVDDSPLHVVERNRRMLRWVSRYTTVRPQHRGPSGAVDPVRAGVDTAACEKIIVAGMRARYCQDALDDICALLDTHEVVEPQEFVEPMPWWGGLDAARLLMHRGIEPQPANGSTFAFRKTAVRGLRGIDGLLPAHDPVRRLASQGAEVFSAVSLFVRRIPPAFDDWLRSRPAEAGADFHAPARTVFFFSLFPLFALLLMAGGAEVGGSFAAMIVCGALALAVRGRIGASNVFPWRACCYAPLALFERAISVYWALFRAARLPDEQQTNWGQAFDVR